ncbi:MAG: PLP-dependent transferase [Bacteroides cellulosilyticus]
MEEPVSSPFRLRVARRNPEVYGQSINFLPACNVADVKSLVIHPASITHSQLFPEELLEQGIKQNTIRLSIGTEHIDDIIADLENRFASLK